MPYYKMVNVQRSRHLQDIPSHTSLVLRPRPVLKTTLGISCTALPPEWAQSVRSAPVALTMRKPEALHILYTIGDCKWEEREKGNCLPQCGGGGFKEIYYVITQTAAGGGAECPNFVHENETVVLECCGEYHWVDI